MIMMMIVMIMMTMLLLLMITITKTMMMATAMMNAYNTSLAVISPTVFTHQILNSFCR